MTPFNIDELLGGRGLFGRAGMPVSEVLGSYFSDPRANQLSRFGLYQEPQSEGMGSWASMDDNWNNQGQRMVGGRGQIQLGDFFRQGKNRNIDDILKLVADPSKIQYDEEAGLITDPSNFVYKPDDKFDRAMSVAVPALLGGAAFAAAGGTGAAAGGDLLPNLAVDTATGGSIQPWGAFAGEGTGFSGFGGSGLFGGLGGGGPGELASVGESGGSLLGGGSPMSVQVNQPGIFGNLPNWAQTGINNITSNPMNALRFGQGIAGLAGAFRGGGSQPATQGGKSGGGQAQMGNVQRPQYTPNPYTQMQLNQLRRFG